MSARIEPSRILPAAHLGENVILGKDSAGGGGRAGERAEKNHPATGNPQALGLNEHAEQFDQEADAEESEGIVDQDDVVIGIDEADQFGPPAGDMLGGETGGINRRSDHQIVLLLE